VRETLTPRNHRQLNARNIDVDQNTHFGYVVSTSLKNGAIQQDILGVDSSVDSTALWGDIGAYSTPISPIGAMPEPTTGALLSIGLLCMLVRRHLSAH
jgi:hypothetical protein